MRLHRKRRREGTHYVRIPLASFEIEGLIRLKVLPKAHREDADALQAAVLTPSSIKHWTWRGNSPRQPIAAGEIVVATRDRRGYSQIERPSRTRGTDDCTHAMSVSAYGRALRARANR